MPIVIDLRAIPWLDMFTATSALAAAVSLGLRANMLKPNFRTFCTAPSWVWASLLALALVCMLVFLSIVRGGGGATPREALLCFSLAVAAVALLVNLSRQNT